MKITVNKTAVKNIEKIADMAAVKTMNVLLGEVRNEQVMPFDTGEMQNEQTFINVQKESEQMKVSIITGSPQARRLYFHPEYNFQRGKNANAGAEWFEPWAEGKYKDFIPETFKKIFKEDFKHDG